MDTKTIEEVVSWARSTDLAELAYRRGGEGIGLRLDSGAPAPEAAFPPCRIVPALSPGVGLLRWSALGSARRAEVGVRVGEGEVLALLDTGRSTSEIKAPASGLIEAVVAEEGKPLQYGQPVLFIAPR